MFQVEFSHLPDMNDPKTVIPRTAKLYTKQEPSERFILILEGRAMVTIGQVLTWLNPNRINKNQLKLITFKKVGGEFICRMK